MRNRCQSACLYFRICPPNSSPHRLNSLELSATLELMSSAVKLILGVSICAMATGFAACDNGGSDNPGSAGAAPSGAAGGPIVIPAAGSGNSAGAPAGGAGAPAAGGGAPGTAGAGMGTAGGPALPEGIPLTPADGWVAAANDAKIEGAMFSYGDPTSLATMTSDFTLTNACIKGTAALVDKASPACKNMMFTAPATDCYGEYWGAAIGLNLAQTIDMTLVPPAGGVAMPYDATALKGFAFEVEGNVVPGPSALRFKVDDGTTEFCNLPTVKVKVGVNTVLFTDLVKACYATPVPTEPLATTVQTKMVKIAWQVVTNDKSAVPFDFCISNVRALLK